VMVLGIY